MAIHVDDGIKSIINILEKDQTPDGSWDYPFETGVTTDAYTIILLRSLGIHDEKLIHGLASRIMNRQEENGAWKVFHDETGGNLTATLEAYYGLLYSGYIKKEERRMQDAKRFILQQGGIEKVNFFTKIMLALTGQYRWPAQSPLPVEIILLPLSFPVNFYQFSVYGRANLASILILADKKFRLTTEQTPDLSDLYAKRTERDDWELDPEWRSLCSTVSENVKNIFGLPSRLHTRALHRLKNYMLDRIESDGTMYSYFSSTFLMIFALLALGHSKTDPLITSAVAGLKTMKTEINGLPHMQYTNASVWNTSLISYALQLAGVSPGDPMVKKANRYLLERQHAKFGDWVIHNQGSMPGGWGFSDSNTINPDIDDTTASLRALSKGVPESPSHLYAWNRGNGWLLSMQNDDGGWSSFEKNVSNKWIGFLPIEKGESMFSDPSSADLTGRTVEFLGNFTYLPKMDGRLRSAVKWLLNNQEKDGSWYGRWGICYLYGTWGAITGLKAAGLSTDHVSIKKALAWIKSTQNGDGGWGESCRSDIQKQFVPLAASTLTDTSWAVDSLIAAENSPTEEIHQGIRYLLASLNKTDWTTRYPKGQAVPDAFYVHYHSYRYIFPLLALSHYRLKFGES